jgi:hypothetical protein
VNPFDEPDVTRAKRNTAALLETWLKTQRLPEWPRDVEEDGLALMTGAGKPPSLAAGLAAHLAQARPGDYLAILAYLPPSPEVASRLAALRVLLRDRLRIATTLGFGPRYLHSTGQLHKGGRPTGIFLVITCDDREDVPVPGSPYGFSTLKAAQALGDLQALRETGLRVARLHLDGNPAERLGHLVQMLRGALRRV